MVEITFCCSWLFSMVSALPRVHTSKLFHCHQYDKKNQHGKACCCYLNTKVSMEEKWQPYLIAGMVPLLKCYQNKFILETHNSQGHESTAKPWYISPISMGAPTNLTHGIGVHFSTLWTCVLGWTWLALSSPWVPALHPWGNRQHPLLLVSNFPVHVVWIAHFRITMEFN